jgi:predicted cupin superfamily sugar epimerase
LAIVHLIASRHLVTFEICIRQFSAASSFLCVLCVKALPLMRSQKFNTEDTEKRGDIRRCLARFLESYFSLFVILSAMKYLLAVATVIASVATLRAAPQSGGDARAREIITALHLTVLPKESGYLGIIGVSPQKVSVDGRKLAVQSQNYYMLTRERPINYLHKLVSADTHILIEGGPVDYFIFHPDGRAEKITLGLDFAAGQRPVIAVPAGCWKALKLHEGASYALMANALSPEFTADRVQIGEGPDWVKRFTNSAPWATPDALREMIGPNWIPR